MCDSLGNESGKFARIHHARLESRSYHFILTIDDASLREQNLDDVEVALRRRSMQRRVPHLKQPRQRAWGSVLRNAFVSLYFSQIINTVEGKKRRLKQNPSKKKARCFIGNPQNHTGMTTHQIPVPVFLNAERRTFVLGPDNFFFFNTAMKDCFLKSQLAGVFCTACSYLFGTFGYSDMFEHLVPGCSKQKGIANQKYTCASATNFCAAPDMSSNLKTEGRY